MLPIQRKLQLLAIALSCSLVAGLVVKAIFERSPRTGNLARSLDLYFYNLFFKPTLIPPSNLVVIDSNDPTESRKRSDYAKMIAQLHDAGAKCIALDIRFSRDSNYDPAGSQELVDVVAQVPEVVLAIDFTSNQHPSATQMARAECLALPDSVCQALEQVNLAPAGGVDLPFDALLMVAKHIGHINSANREYHRFPPALKFDRKCYAALPIEIARHYFTPEDSDVVSVHRSTNGNGQEAHLQPSRFHLTNIPLDSDGQMLVNFISLEAFPPLPYSWSDATQLLQNQAGKFRSAVVLIVNSSTSAEPPLMTPWGPYPSWALLASLTSQLLLHRYIEASALFYPVVFSAFVVLLGVLWLLFVAPRLAKKWRKTRLIFIAGTLLFLVLVFALLNLSRQWIGVSVPLLAFNTSMLVVRAKYYRMIRAPQPQYQNLGVAVSEIYSIQVFESPGGEEQGNPTFQSFLEEDDFKSTLQKLRNLEAQQEDFEWMGDKLFNAVFQNGIFQHLKNGLEKAQNDEKILRLKLRLDASELVCLPWELMCTDKLSPSFLALHKRLSLTRYLPLDQPIPKRHFRIPLKILVVISSPIGLPELNVEREKRLIKKSLRSLIWAGDIRLRFCKNATREKLMKELKREPHILHYIGHGEFDAKNQKAFLLLESETQESDRVDTKVLAVMLQERSVNLVVLNSCETASAASTDVFTGMAQNLVKVGIPAVVAMQYKILDDSALSFSQVFYPTLFRSNSIDTAVAEARQHIVIKGKMGLSQQDWAAPVLFMRAPDGKIFEMET